MTVAKCVNTLEEILKLIPVEVNMSGQVDFDKEIENKNYKPYVYYDEKRQQLKVFRVYRKTLETLFSVYDYGTLPSPYVSNFEATLFLSKERDSKAIKALPIETQNEIKRSMLGCAHFNDFDEFKSVLTVLLDKIKWSF